jgi:steroid delta-isomerase-like uncharacterized protein
VTDGEVITAYYAAFNRGDWDGMCALLSDDVAHDLNQGERQLGRDAFRRFLDRMARPGGGYRNRLRVHGAEGGAVEVEKLQMTRFEREQWGVQAGAGQTVIDLGPAWIGVAICYDAEFPLIARRLAAAGAQVIAVPSCTDALAGYHRVRIACAARALENQCYVVQAPTVGIAPWSIAVDENVGAAGVFAPADRGFPDDGVLALGALDAPGWIIADLDLEALERVRSDGQVLGHRDWDRDAHLAGDVARSTLRSV